MFVCQKGNQGRTFNEIATVQYDYVVLCRLVERCTLVARLHQVKDASKTYDVELALLNQHAHQWRSYTHKYWPSTQNKSVEKAMYCKRCYMDVRPGYWVVISCNNLRQSRCGLWNECKEYHGKTNHKCRSLPWRKKRHKTVEWYCQQAHEVIQSCFQKRGVSEPDADRFHGRK